MPDDNPRFTEWTMQCDCPCVLPHDEGILWVEAGASIGVSFCWHECTEEPRGDPWPVLEIRKAIVDQGGASHVAAHFTTAWGVFCSVNGRNVYTPDAFRYLNDSLFDGELRPTTDSTKFLSDSRDILLFHFHDGSSLEPRVCSHFDKYSGGDVRLIWSGREIGPFFLETHLAYLDDRVTNELIDPGGALFLEVNIDFWSTVSDVRNARDYWSTHLSPLKGRYGPFPPVFARVGTQGLAQEGVHVFPEPWSPTRAKELVDRNLAEKD